MGHHKMSKDMKHDMKNTSMEHTSMKDHKCDANCKHDEKMMKEMKSENHVCDENCKHDEMMKDQKKDADKKMDKLKGKI